MALIRINKSSEKINTYKSFFSGSNGEGGMYFTHDMLDGFTEMTYIQSSNVTNVRYSVDGASPVAATSPLTIPAFSSELLIRFSVSSGDGTLTMNLS